MNSIINAISAGYSSKQIIDYIIRQFPQHKDKIQNALAAGYTAERILQYLSGGREAVTKAQGIKTEHEQTVESERETQRKERQGTMAAGAVAAAPLFAPMAEAALSRAAPQILQKLQPQVTSGIATRNIPNAALGESQIKSPISSNITQQPPAVSAGNIPQAPGIPQAKTSITDPRKYLEEKGVLEIVDNSLKRGNTPDGIMAEIAFKGKRHVKEDPELLANIEAYAKEQPKEAGNAPAELQVPQQRAEQVLPETKAPVEEKPVEAKPIAKKDIVASPQGVGEVLEIRNGKALVEIDGKKHVVDEDELEAEPEEVKKSKIEFDIASVPEDLRSAPLNEVYVPGHRKHITIKFNANAGVEKDKRYLYFRKDGKPIDNEIIEKLRNGVQLPVTSGSNFWGAWDAETEDSRGTVAFHELTKMAQEEGEEDDPSKPYWFVKEEEVFTHGYRKGLEQELKKKEKEFNEERKKRKKK